MAEKVRKQILSNEALNTKGFHVLNQSIDWTRYKKNPILLRNPHTGEHYGEPIGRVENIRLENGSWVGELIFGTSPVAKQAKEDYDAGILNGVSIFGMARVVERNNRKVTSYFNVWEISLVNIPSNPDAVAIREGREGLSAVSFEADEVETEAVTALSATQLEFINQFETSMTDENKNVTPSDTKDDMVSLSALSKFLQLIGIARKKIDLGAEGDTEKEGDKAEGLSATKDAEAKDATKEEPKDNPEGLAAGDKSEEPKDEPKDGEKPEGLSATEGEQTEEEPKQEPAKTGLSVGEGAKIYNPTTQSKSNKAMVVPFSKYISDPANEGKLQSIVALSASADTADGLAQVALSAEDADTMSAIQELAASMLADKNFMVTIENVSFDVNGGKSVKASETIQALASGQKSGNFIANADLAKVVWLSLFVRQLFPSNRWAERVRRLSVRDREGIIWVESAMNPEIYFGDRAPVNAPNYLYDDLPRGLARKVFSLQPIVWQPSNSDILGYNDRATGMAEAGRIMATMIHNYWLQAIAESVPAANQVAMSGANFASAGRFPINSAATGNLKSLTLNDLIGVQGKFLARNLGFTRGDGVAVMAEPYYTSLAQSDEVKSILTAQLSNARPDGFTYGGFDIMARSIVAAYNTATSTVVDAEMYFDKPVDFATGAIDDEHVKPVLAATVYDIGLAFIPEEVVVAIGNTNVHMVSDPNNYGWKMSMDVSTGAGTLRSSAAGVALLKPTVGA